MTSPHKYRTAVIAAAAAMIACLIPAEYAKAEVLELACDRIDVSHPIDYLWLVDTTGMTVSEASGPVQTRRTFPARITAATIDWEDHAYTSDQRVYHIDRLSGRMAMNLLMNGLTIEFDCKRTQGF
jgi:hypothetical protein